MKIERKNLEKSIVELIIEVDTKKVSKFRKKAIAYLTENADIKWFRKGHIKENMLVKHYWEDYISQMTVDFSIDDVYRDALKKEKLLPVAQWEIKEVISQSPMKIRMQVEVFPNVIMGKDYRKVSLDKKEITVEKTEIAQAIEDIETKFTTFQEVKDEKYVVVMGDRVSITTQWFDTDWKELENTNMEEYPLVLWSGMLVKGFEEGLVWTKIGEELELPIVFPEDYHNKDFAGMTTKFSIKITKIEQYKKPEFTPEFIKQLRGKDLDLKGFKNLLKSEILDTKESNARMEEESELIEKLLEHSTIEIGDKLLWEQIEKVFSEIKQNMQGDEIKMSDYLESLKMSEEQYKETHVVPVALKRLQWELIFSQIVTLEPKEIHVSEKEMNEEITKIKSTFENPEVLERLEKLYTPENQYYQELQRRMEFRKVIESFYSKKK